MKDRFLRIKGLGVVSDAWLINNRGDVIHSQLTGGVNKKMLADMSQRVLQLLALQSAYIGANGRYIALTSEDTTIFGFDLGPLVLVALCSNAVDPAGVFEELQAIADEFRTDDRLISKHERKGMERREQIAESRLDEKARGLLQELKKSGP